MSHNLWDTIVDIERLRDSRRKLEDEIDIAKANTKTALKEARANDVKKDKIDNLISTIKKRIDENETHDKELKERKKAML